MLAKDQYMYCLWRNIQTDTWISNNHQHSLTSMAIVGNQNHKAINIRKSNIEHKIVILYEMVWLVGFILFKATSNNISVISWRSVLLVDETGGPRENHWPVASNCQTRFELTTSVVIGTDYIGSCKSNYHTITATMASYMKWHINVLI